MVKKWLVALLLCCTGMVNAKVATEYFLTAKTKVVFLETAAASNVLKNRDAFIAALGEMERASRLYTNQPVSIEAFLKRIGSETLDWKAEEKKQLGLILVSIRNKFAKLNLDFPPQVSLIKTTGNEEGNAAYCRGNSVILSLEMLERDLESLENLLIHELFHIYSKNHLAKREKLYNLIGFFQCPELEWPVELKANKLTNPDAYSNDYYMTIRYQGTLTKVIPILYLNQSFCETSGQLFFENSKFSLLEVEVANGECQPVYRNKMLSLLNRNQNYFNQIGENTDYTIHPEEILAENFVLLVNQTPKVKSPFVIEGMKKVLGL